MATNPIGRLVALWLGATLLGMAVATAGGGPFDRPASADDLVGQFSRL